MGRLKERPKGYQPALQFYFRREVEGGGVRDPGDRRAVGGAESRTSCLVMVHGFNNNDGEAAIAYAGWRNRQVEEYGVSPEELNARLADAFWTGDADWGFFDFADFGIYSTAVGNARATAKALRAMLLGMPNLLEVDFIGHSLGCRVILETLELFRQNGDGPAIRRVCLMAAAVPMEKVEPGMPPDGRYYQLLADLAATGTRILILHSRQDIVLHLAFGAGQFMAGPDERSNRALGREGPNPLMPGYPGTIEERQMGGAGHGDYWGHSGSVISRESTKQAGRFFGLSTAREIGVARSAGVPQPGFLERVAFGDARLDGFL